MGRKVGLGIVGLGNICGIYMKNSGEMFKDILEIKACADVLPDRATAAVEKIKTGNWGSPAACKSVAELMKRDDVEIVLNLTIPAAHHDVAMQAVAAGKHVHNEKPLCVTRVQAQELLALAAKKNLRVGCAPDTILGAGHQTARKLIDDGAIGKPVAATAFMMCHGHETWHPNPEFFYKPGGGPMFDMGPYYMTDLIQLLGPVAGVAGMTSIGLKQRTITSQPLAGKVVDVEIPTHVAGTMRFVSGAVATAVMSFEIWAHHCPIIEIHGTEGSLAVPDPNRFGGPVKIRKGGAKEWVEAPLTHSYPDNSRGIAVADMAMAIQSGRPHRCNGELAYHVLETMWAFHDASDSGKEYRMQSTCRRPAPMPMNVKIGELDA